MTEMLLSSRAGVFEELHLQQRCDKVSRIPREVPQQPGLHLHDLCPQDVWDRPGVWELWAGARHHAAQRDLLPLRPAGDLGWLPWRWAVSRGQRGYLLVILTIFCWHCSWTSHNLLLFIAVSICFMQLCCAWDCDYFNSKWWIIYTGEIHRQLLNRLWNSILVLQGQKFISLVVIIAVFIFLCSVIIIQNTMDVFSKCGTSLDSEIW